MQEIRIGMLGSVDAGKTTTTSVLINNIIDDGRGSARHKIFRHQHEKNTGRTSSITENYLKFKDKYINFIDLAGHEKYLGTTMYGLAGHYIDYSIIFVGGNMGISTIMHEHLILTLSLRIPFIFVVTKIDIAPEDILKNTIENIKKTVKKYSTTQNIVSVIKETSDIENINLNRIFPIFLISNKTGKNIDLLKIYLSNLNSRFVWKNLHDSNFIINHRYNVKGIGIVFSGKLISGKVKKYDKLLLGPINGKWINIVAKSLHDNFKNNVEYLSAGESGCIAVKAKSDATLKGKLKKGLVIINKINKNATKEFDANIYILSKHSTTIKPGYSPIINCDTIVQTAKITNIYDKSILRGGEKALVKFSFCFRPEYIDVNKKFIFRDGKTKGFGKIEKIY